MEKLPQEFKEKWVTALRSGKYEQGKGRLKNGLGEYCCIGIFCEVNNIPYNETSMLDQRGDEIGYKPLQDFIGPKTDILWRKNDTNNESFSEIADYIEKEL